MADFFSDIFGGQAGKDAAAANTGRLNQLQTTGLGYLDAGQSGALGALGNANAAYDPLKALAAKYGTGSGLYLDSLGVNGPEGNARATGAFHAGPSYNWDVGQALDGVNRGAVAAGGAPGGLSGNTLAALSDRAGNMADREFSGWQDRLAGLISPELSATGGAASGTAGVDLNLSNLYQTDANQRLGLDKTVTGGINDQTTQGANAELAGAGNALKAGMGIATLAAGGLGGMGGLAALGGGTALLGGGGKAGGPQDYTGLFKPGGQWSFG